MKYGTITIYPLAGSMRIMKFKEQLVRHYPGTDETVSTDLGQPATRISCILKAESQAEKTTIEQFLHDEAEQNLEIGPAGSEFEYYKEVMTGANFEITPQDTDGNLWFIQCEFIAKDPVPYDITTGVAKY